MDKVQEISVENPDKKIEVWFQDEARFGQQGTISRKWALKGTRPPAAKQTQYDYLYVIGAVCPQTGQSVGLLSPYINAKIMNKFLEQFSNELDKDVHAVIIWDRAGFHTAKEIRAPSNITLIYLPPYSPELNPIENLWHYLKKNEWSNRIYNDYEALIKAACLAWQKHCLNPELIRSVCNVPYITKRKI